MIIGIIGRPKSKAVVKIVKNTDLVRYNKRCSSVINYGLSGKHMDEFISKRPVLRNKPMINRYTAFSKFKMIRRVKDIITTPESYTILPKNKKLSDFIIKKVNSQGGKGIKVANRKTFKEGYYYQRFISERKYELRVHGFLWVPLNEWKIQKRLGRDDVIAWNYSNGGKFQTINNTNYSIFQKAIEVTEKILKKINLAFGATDFIVTNKGELVFLEINTAPGFTNFSEPIYINAFNKLNSLTRKEFNILAR